MSNRVISCETVCRQFTNVSVLGQEEAVLKHLEDCDNCMDAWVVFCLERRPRIDVPEDFGHRVAAAGRTKSQTPVHRNTWLTGSLGLLAVALLVLFVMLDGQDSKVAFQSLVTLLTLEAFALVLWLGRTSAV